IDTLHTFDVKGADSSFIRKDIDPVWCHDGDRRGAIHANPRLTASRTSFAHVGGTWKLERISPGHADATLTIIACHLHTSLSMVTARGTPVDGEPVAVAYLDDITERRERLSGQTFKLEN